MPYCGSKRFANCDFRLDCGFSFKARQDCRDVLLVSQELAHLGLQMPLVFKRELEGLPQLLQPLVLQTVVLL